MARDGLAAVVRVGPAVAWEHDVSGEVLWEVDAEESSSEAVHELRGAAVRGSLDLPAGWWWVAPFDEGASSDDDDTSDDDATPSDERAREFRESMVNWWNRVLDGSLS